MCHGAMRIAELEMIQGPVPDENVYNVKFSRWIGRIQCGCPGVGTMSMRVNHIPGVDGVVWTDAWGEPREPVTR